MKGIEMTVKATSENREADPEAGRRKAKKGLFGVISRRPITSFFVLAFSLSWLAWTPYVLSRSGMGILDFDFPSLLGTTQLVGMMPGAYLGPILSAFLVTAIADGRPGIREWLGRFGRWRVSWVWYAAVLAGVPSVLTVAGVLMTGGQGVQAPPLTILLAYLPLLAIQLITTGLAEEPGWRDFALPRLQPRFGALGANLILGPVWGFWHLPLFLTSWGGWPDVQVTDVLEFVAMASAISVVMTWVFNKTNQSLPVQMLLHASINTYASLVWTATIPGADHDFVTRGVLLASGAAAFLSVILTRGRLGWHGPAFGALRDRG